MGWHFRALSGTDPFVIDRTQVDAVVVSTENTFTSDVAAAP
jgi:hypothetical protein